MEKSRFQPSTIFLFILSTGITLSGMENKQLERQIKCVELGRISPIIIPLKDMYSVRIEEGKIGIFIEKQITEKEVEWVLEEIADKKNYKAVLLECKALLTKIPFNLTLFKNLKELNIQANPLYSLEGVGALTALQIIHFCDNKEISSLEPLLSCTNLEIICGGDNRITEIPGGIKNLKSLRQIGLSNNRITSLKTLTDCTNLMVVNLNGNTIKSIPESIIHNTKLVSLELGGNRIEEIDNLSPLFLQLNNLNLAGNPLNAEKCDKALLLLDKESKTLRKIADKSNCPNIERCFANIQRNGRHLTIVNAQRRFNVATPQALIQLLFPNTQENNNNNDNN